MIDIVGFRKMFFSCSRTSHDAGSSSICKKRKGTMSEARFVKFVKGRYWVTLTKTAEHPYKVFQYPP
jgi:hypothetical protein